MDLTSLQPYEGSKKNRKRKGRGPGSGFGKTSGRGQNGAGARKSSGISPAFEGGQMPLQKRIPKRGFNSLNPVQYQIVNLVDLEKKCDGEVNVENLYKLGLISKKNGKVKILGNGSITKSLKITVDSCSESATAAIEKSGGTVVLISTKSKADK